MYVHVARVNVTQIWKIIFTAYFFISFSCTIFKRYVFRYTFTIYSYFFLQWKTMVWFVNKLFSLRVFYRIYHYCFIFMKTVCVTLFLYNYWTSRVNWVEIINGYLWLLYCNAPFIKYSKYKQDKNRICQTDKMRIVFELNVYKE